MENIGRREFIKKTIFFSTSILTPYDLFAKREGKVHIKLLKEPIKYYIKSGKKRSSRVLIIGGIHGNEIGAYKASDLLVDCKIKKGELIIIPRSNFTSILANVRGYNGDMNRKFSHISKKDADFFNVLMIKELIKNLKPDVVISLHDGYGFNRLNKNHWGQCVVIDEKIYNNFNLYNIAKFVVDNANNKLDKNEKLSLHNTYTFTKNIHKEQKNALTGWCLKNSIPAFCIEASKQLPTLERKIFTHLTMLEEFFKIYDIQLEPSINYIHSNIKNLLNEKNSLNIKIDINGQLYSFNKSTIIKVKKGSDIFIKDISGNRGSAFIPKNVNLNWRSFYFSNSIDFIAKNDYKKEFVIKIVPV